MPFVFFGNQQTMLLVWSIYGSCLWNHVKANMSYHPDQLQWTQTILWTNCYSNAKEEAFCRFRKNCQARFNPAFVFQHFTILTAISLLCTHLKTVAKTNFCFMIQIAILVNLIYIFFFCFEKILTFEIRLFFWCLSFCNTTVLNLLFYGRTHTCMAGTSHAQHYLRRAFARCSVSPQVRFISLSSARCSSPSAFSATQRSFYGVDSILAQSWESPDFPYMPYPTHFCGASRSQGWFLCSLSRGIDLHSTLFWDRRYGRLCSNCVLCWYFFVID